MPDEVKPITPAETTQTQQPENIIEPEKRILGFKQNVFYLGIISLLNDAASEIIYPLVPMFLRTVFRTQFGIFLGIIEGIAEGTASLMKLFSGWYSDKIKKNKAFVITGYGISVFLRPLLGLANFISSWLYVLSIRFSDRIGKGVRTAPRDALIANSVDPEERGKSFGFHRAMDHLGAVIGSLFAYGLIKLFLELTPPGFQLVDPSRLWWIFLFAFIPGIVSLFFLVYTIKDVSISNIPKERAPKAGSLGTGAQPRKIDKRFKIFLLILTLFTLGNSSDMFLLDRVANIKGIGIRVTLVWAAFHVVKSVLSTPAGIISDYLGRRGVIILGWLIYAGVYFGFGFAGQSANAAWILFMIYGVYYALTEGVAKALVADLAPKEARGTAFGWFHSVEGVAVIPASIIFGLFYNWRPWFAFSFGATLALAAAVLLIIFVPSKVPPESIENPEAKPQEVA